MIKTAFRTLIKPYLKVIQENSLTENKGIEYADSAVQSLKQEMLANDRQPAKTILSVALASTGKVVGCSLSDNNVVEVYANADDYKNGVVKYRKFMKLGEPIVFTDVWQGAIVTSTGGFYGYSDLNNTVGTKTFSSLMPLLSLGLAFKQTYFYTFRFSEDGLGAVFVTCGAIKTHVKLIDANSNQVIDEAQLEAFESATLSTQANTNYKIEAGEYVMAVFSGNTPADPIQHKFNDIRIIMPLSNDCIFHAEGSVVSALYDGSTITAYTSDGQIVADQEVSPTTGLALSTLLTTLNEYRPASWARIRANGLISSFSGADGGGGDVTPSIGIDKLSHVVAQPMEITLQTGRFGGLSIASPYVGTAKIYEYDFTTQSLVLKHTVPLIRDTPTTTLAHQNHPASHTLVGSFTDGTTGLNPNAYTILTESIKAGVIIADVPIAVVVQSFNQTMQLPNQDGVLTDLPYTKGDETLMLGVTPPARALETVLADNGSGEELIYKRVLMGGVESWEVA